ncbi:hypothetical protein [Campylobacter lari]|uniref:hypothetical protein n=1 Tax=Campylobacter lari TaxID=201 RepID=UPI00127CCF33|nr:hypothetical protein [Campylobacter lari]EAI5464497.1 hypothetical protein [Campylobacter lari]EAJ1108490.1 hypothetical protein [Campylobacter lari]EAL3898541.1 hypothetical protein [Campylobacter lari]EGK7501303.1 hypothetical protein [Campylobacter lari]MCR2071247.1 hypothetical protein [Campylobacter lari subsp. concheus]
MLQTMKHILTHTDETLLAKKFGYNNVEKFTKTKTLFLECKSIQEWLLKGHYDMVNSSLEFIQKFDFILDRKILNSILEQNVLLKDKYTKLQEAKAIIKTNFKRKSDLMFLSHLRVLKFPISNDMLYLDKKQIIQKLKELAIKHYENSQGKLKLWGDILQYDIIYDDELLVLSMQKSDK